MRIAVVLWAAVALAWGATPDQVVVLYNADWTEDLDGTEPGQDSLEVARYYVAQRTDPKTGKKPCLLGLRCADPKAKRLDQMRLPEDSQDNPLGIRHRKDGSQPRDPPFSGTFVVYFYSHQFEALDPASLTIRASPTDDEADAVVVYGDGGPKPGYSIRATTFGGLRGWGFADRKAFPDGFTAWVEARNKDGKALRGYKARFAWPDDFERDVTGPDGIRDDANYLADVEQPIKQFLEDPANALPDGTLLRDHILYFAICYGLPKQVESLYGIARGVRGRCGWGDAGSALEARLQLLYHNVARYHQLTVLPLGADAVSAARIASRLRLTLAGANPFRHPMAHQGRKYAGLARNRLYKSYDYDAKRIPHFTAALRRALGDRTLYIATRLDGRHPELAKAQVDGARYGERYLTPFLGWFWHGTYKSAPQAAEELRFFEFRDGPPERPQPHERGRVLFYFGDLGYSKVCAADPAKPPVPYWRGFYPGSVGYAVRSGLGWYFRRRVSQLYDGNSLYPERMLDAGVTACALSAHGSHDTSGTWPDDQVFFHHLLRGYTLGECFLISKVYLDWLQSHVGDPLYRPELRHTEPDDEAPRVASRDDVAIELGQADGRYWARIRPTLDGAPDNPEMTDIAVAYWRQPDRKHRAADWRFSRRPTVLLPVLEPASTYHIDVALTDPYGNRFSSAEALGDIALRTGPPPPARRLLLEWRPEPGAKPRHAVNLITRERGDARPLVPERGEIHIELTTRGPGFDLVSSRRRRFLLDSRGFTVGGRIAASCPPPGKRGRPVFDTGRRYRLIARWRRDPVVRQIVLVAKDGREFLLGSNNRLCWLADTHGSILRLHQDHCVVHHFALYDDTRPQPLDPLYPAHFDIDGFNAADGIPAEQPQGEKPVPPDSE